MKTPPWTTALEMKFAALRSHAMIHVQELVDPEKADQVFPGQINADGMRLLQRAEVFSWTADTSRAAFLASRTIPGDSVITHTMLPAPACWWFFEEPLALRWSPVIEEPATCSAMVVSSALDQGLHGEATIMLGMLYEFYDVPAGRLLVPCGWFTATEGETLNSLHARHIKAGSSAVQTFRFVLAACVWLRQRILTLGLGHIERHRRKQLAREHQQPMPSDVKVIQLRRLESSPQARTGDAEPVDWSCRWIVNGHWRNQPYKGDRKLIYIMPFVKGPEDKPLRVPTHTVYQVDR
jgi:hypothetical protein